MKKTKRRLFILVISIITIFTGCTSATTNNDDITTTLFISGINNQK